MDIPNDSISQINTYITIFRIKYKKDPTRAIINDDSLSLLNENAMLMPNNNFTGKGYTGNVLINEREIQFLPVYLLEKLPEKEKSELEEKVKDIKCPIILANKKNHYVCEDLTLCDEELVKLKEEAETSQ